MDPVRCQPVRPVGITRMAGIGASRPLRRIPAIVSFLNPQPALSLVGGNRSSCPQAVINSFFLLAPPDPRRGRVLVPISPLAQPCAIGDFAQISSTPLNIRRSASSLEACAHPARAHRHTRGHRGPRRLSRLRYGPLHHRRHPARRRGLSRAVTIALAESGVRSP